MEEADRGQRLHGHLGEEVGQRRRQVAFQRHQQTPHAGVVDLQRSQSSNRPWLRPAGFGSADRPQEGGDREAQARRIVAGRLRLALVAAADDDQRHAQPVGLIVVLEPLHLVVGDELEMVEVVGLPDAAAEHAGDVPRAGRRVDGLGRARPQFAAIAAQSQGRFQGAVIKVARAAELRVVAVARRRQPVVEQERVGVQHGRAVEIQGLGLVLLLDLAGREVGQFRHGIDLIGRRLLLGDALQVLQQRRASRLAGHRSGYRPAGVASSAASAAARSARSVAVHRPADCGERCGA